MNDTDLPVQIAAQNYYKKLKNTLANPKNKPIFTKLQGYFAEITRFFHISRLFLHILPPRYFHTFTLSHIFVC